MPRLRKKANESIDAPPLDGSGSAGSNTYAVCVEVVGADYSEAEIIAIAAGPGAAIVLATMRRFAWLRDLRHQPKVVAGFAVAAVLLSGNWLLYVWAVSSHRVLDASLGYFINPLVNVMLGFVVLHERPRPWQWLAVAMAAAGVLWLTVAAGSLPWVSLALALSFGVYGLLRKTAALGALEGLTLATEQATLKGFAAPLTFYRLTII